MRLLTKQTLLSVALASTITLSGCSAVHTAVSKRNLDVNTAASETIWLQPSAAEKSVYVQVRNSTDKKIKLKEHVLDALSGGYTVSTDPESANYWLQMNVIKLEKMDLRDANVFLQQGYGTGLAGAAAAASVANYNTGSVASGVGAGLLGGLASVAADAMVEDVNYALITDVQISEKTQDVVSATTKQSLKQGTGGSQQLTRSSQSNRLTYQTRLLSNANQVNLDFEDAAPALADSVAASISGMMAR